MSLLTRPPPQCLSAAQRSYDIAYMSNNAKERHVPRDRLRVVATLHPGDPLEVRPQVV